MEANASPDEERISLQIEAAEITIAPGESRTFSVTLVNSGETADTVDISLSGAPASWVTGAARSVELPPDGQHTYDLLFAVPADAQIGRFPFGISIISRSDPDQFARARLSVNVSVPETIEKSTRIDLLVATDTFTVAPGAGITIPVVLVNEGSAEDRFSLMVEGIPNNWVSTSESLVPLAPGERKTVDIHIQPSPGTLATRTKFRIVASSYSSSEESAAVECTLTVAAYEVTGRVDILMQAMQYSVAPGAQVSVPVVLINQGLVEDTLSVLVEGVPPEWVSLPARSNLLSPGQEKSVTVTIQPPRGSPSRAGRTRFKIRVVSVQDPEHAAEVDCTLDVAAYSQFQSALQPNQVPSGQTAEVVINNLGNAQASYQVFLSSQDDRLTFGLVQPQAPAQVEVQPPPPETPYNPEVPPTLRVPAGDPASIYFAARARQRPLVGGEILYPFKTRVEAAGLEPQVHEGVVSDKAWLPVWVFVVLLILGGALCLTALGLGTAGLRGNQANQATQTAVYLQTLQAQVPITATLPLAVTPDDVDTDGDGLPDQFELQIGTDPIIADSDADALNDGAEVNVHLTDPLNQDTDVDGAIDGVEVNQGTNPLNPDTDSDQLLDGQEALPCPDPLNPDSDGDGLLDGADLDPCDPNNPSMTATAIAALPLETPVPPTEVPPTEAAPTEVPPTAETPAETPTTESPQQPVVEGNVAFSSNRQGDFDIHIVPSEGTNVFPLTTGAGSNIQAALSPDGSKIAFTSNRDGNNEIYVMNVDGSDPVNLTNNPADDQDPAWSPDGTGIVFTSNRDGNQEIYGIAGTGGDVLNLTNNPADDSQPHWFSVQGLFSSSGDWIVFSSNRDGNLEVYRMAIDGSDQLNLSNNPGNDFAPVGNPRSDRVAFTSDRDGNQEIYLMDIDGQLFGNLTNNSAQDFNPTWNAGGGRLAFTSDRDGNLEIYLMVEDGTEQTNFTNNPAIDDFATWN